MNNTTIVHDRGRQAKKRPYSDPRKVTVKALQFVCPISREETSFKDPRLCFFSMHGQRVPVNGQAFLDFCASANWPVPKLSDDFDIESWLIERTREVAAMPEFEPARWLAITNFASQLGLRIKFFVAIRRVA
jgi:hypothetical protein